MLFLDDIFLTVAVSVTFNSSSIISKPKTLESVLVLLGVNVSKAMVVFEVLGVDFVLTYFGYFIGLFLSILSNFVCHPAILSSSL